MTNSKITKQDEKREALSLNNCDKEPVHIPGHIQDFAVLLSTDPSFERITSCSENAEALFDRPIDRILGSSLADLLPDDVVHDLLNTFGISAVQVQRERVGLWKREDAQFEIWVHISNNIPVIELERLEANDPEPVDPLVLVRGLLARIGHTENLQRAFSDAVLGLKNLSGFDRVMLYQFDQTGAGEVVAEACGPGMESFLGLRFPSWDIPNQVRDIMVKLPLRVIADVQSPKVLLRSSQPDGAPLDLTLAASRGTSPIHAEYMTNMGVAGSMTLSITVRGKLWGLIAFHHASPRRIHPSLRGAAELFIQFFGLQLEQRLDKERNAIRSVALSYEGTMLKAADTVENLSQILENIAEPLCALVKADGAAIIRGEHTSLIGSAPSMQNARDIAAALLLDADNDTPLTPSIRSLGIEVGEVAGALALVIDRQADHVLVFFRKEAIGSVSWAGAPDKIVVEDNGPRLKPRGSFAAYSETVRGHSLPWSEDVVEAASALRAALSRTNESIYKRVTLKEERKRTLYVEELNHRVRNILTLIRSLARQTKESSTSLEAYAASLEARIQSLGAAHDLATDHLAQGVRIGEIFEMEMKPYDSQTDHRFVLTEEAFYLRADVAPTFALIVHELVTNSVKYGALSAADGRIDLRVRGEKDGVRIEWIERGGPPILEVPNKKGFGLGLIERGIPYELDGEANIEFSKSGLRASFWLPEKTLEKNIAQSVIPLNKETDVKPAKISMPLRVLLLEDSMMVALDMESMLEQLGATHVDAHPTVEQAMESIKVSPPDIAILDINLRDGKSFVVAELLESEGIPFCFASGLGSNAELPAQHAGASILTKPVDYSSLRAILEKLKIS